MNFPPFARVMERFIDDLRAAHGAQIVDAWMGEGARLSDDAAAALAFGSG